MKILQNSNDFFANLIKILKDYLKVNLIFYINTNVLEHLRSSCSINYKFIELKLANC